MNFDKAPSLKIIGKIELEPKKNPEKDLYVRRTRDIVPHIEESMPRNIKLVQERMSAFEGAPENLIDASGSINIDSFSSAYSSHEIENDKRMTHEEKKAFLKTYEPSVQEKYGSTDQDELVRLIELDSKEKMRDGNISEDLLFLMMNKIAGDRYITLRAAQYDDYRNGVDMVLVDTETDAVICTFDATVSDVNSRMEHKMKRAKDRVDSGRGFFMKYGVSFDSEQKINLGAIQNTPPLFLDLNKKDLKDILHSIDFSLSSDLSDLELKTASSLLDSLDSQIIELETRAAKNISYNSSREFVEYMRNVIDSKS